VVVVVVVVAVVAVVVVVVVVVSSHVSMRLGCSTNPEPSYTLQG